MRITPPPLEIGPNDGFDGTDIFGYAEFGKRFANMVCNLDQPLTAVLDGPWGSGKSTFIQQWAGELRNRGVPVILFDAFANDHHEDAFTALAGEIVALARDELGGSDSRTKKLIKSATKVSKAIMPVATRIGFRMATLNLLSLEDVEDAGEAAKAAVKELGNEAAKAAETAVKERVTKARDERLELQGFREQLAKLAKNLLEKAAKENEDGQRRPLVFIIDELDRCRPPFALNLLERIKHLFSVPGVTFVLVTNLDQMNRAVRGAYGPDTDGRAYLEKFYELRVALPVPEQPHEQKTRQYVEHLWRVLELDSGESDFDRAVREGLSVLAEHHGIDLRGLERIATHVALTYAATGPQTMKLAPLIVGLCVMRQMDPDLYDSARHGRLSWPRAQEFLDAKSWRGDTRSDWYENWWRFVTDVDADQNEKWFRQVEHSLFKYSFSDRLSLLPWTAKRIDDFVVVDRKRETS